jgi:DNA-binding GntR family transcriptional regulator
MESRCTRTEMLCQRIADEILNGVFKPGDRLEELALAKRYGLSRTPVREALRYLASTRLVEISPRRGASVSLPDDATLAELFEVLGELEAACARLASVRMSPAERTHLSAAQSAALEAARNGDVDRYLVCNREFHRLIYIGAHNGSLLSAVQSMRERVAPFSRAQFRLPGRLLQSHAEHEKVVSAIRAGDPVSAADSMRWHVVDIRSASTDYMHGLETAEPRRSATSPSKRNSAAADRFGL